ncbi:DUF695 domain-containing protein [Planomicrobium sp. CPCC 101110]|uniref:DUF695 domain-containing protein n=1 Tax=Planomicrobium sp. CPCC 101110 TaxID=2599619 RepID=UPI0011B796E4|nr:DUF695 domain-containing protein [Planomicrobium sp. CPCC 101110]TWT25125.1 DUF695 domain-containing protein [Planomicrobium sp. CPCC 101110]
MSEYWNAYVDLIDGKPASIVLDMEVSQELDMEEYKNAFAVRLPLKKPNEDGLHAGAEADRLTIVEEELLEAAELKGYANVGKLTTDGNRDIFFYSPHEEEEELALIANRLYFLAGYEVEVFKLEETQSWDFYFEFLYPDSFQFQHMGNHEVLETLAMSGDDLEAPRRVEHFVLFQSEKTMKRFADSIQQEGFTIEEGSFEKDDEGNYVMCISRVDFVTYNAIDELTDFLVEISARYQGEYDGWETVVVIE